VEWKVEPFKVALWGKVRGKGDSYKGDEHMGAWLASYRWWGSPVSKSARASVPAWMPGPGVTGPPDRIGTCEQSRGLNGQTWSGGSNQKFANVNYCLDWRLRNQSYSGSACLLLQNSPPKDTHQTISKNFRMYSWKSYPIAYSIKCTRFPLDFNPAEYTRCQTISETLCTC